MFSLKRWNLVVCKNQLHMTWWFLRTFVLVLLSYRVIFLSPLLPTMQSFMHCQIFSFNRNKKKGLTLFDRVIENPVIPWTFTWGLARNDASEPLCCEAFFTVSQHSGWSWVGHITLSEVEVGKWKDSKQVTSWYSFLILLFFILSNIKVCNQETVNEYLYKKVYIALYIYK